MEKEYKEIMAQSGPACEIKLMESHKYGPMCIAIKTADKRVHVIYADSLKYPYTASRYLGYIESEHSLDSLILELDDYIKQFKPEFNF
jgi:hypothetical protein